MSYTFCTLFDKNYLYKGLVLYQSLVDHCSDFKLWILCMDDETYSLLEKMRLDHVELIHLEEFEDDELRHVRKDRTAVEYCWTCTPSLVLFVIKRNPSARQVAYLDADLMFYGDPSPIYEELGDKSILIVPHRYASGYRDLEKTSGTYNVSMVIFRNSATGVESVTYWRERCLEACRLDPEAGLCGDQKYLDDWPARFEDVVALRHKGGGLAPWNLSRYRLTKREGATLVDEDTLIFFHFQSLLISQLSFLNRSLMVASRGYRLSRQQLSIVYSPYAKGLRNVIDQVSEIDPAFRSGYTKLSLGELVGAFQRGNLLFA